MAQVVLLRPRWPVRRRSLCAPLSMPCLWAKDVMRYHLGSFCPRLTKPLHHVHRTPLLRAAFVLASPPDNAEVPALCTRWVMLTPPGLFKKGHTQMHCSSGQYMATVPLQLICLIYLDPMGKDMGCVLPWNMWLTLDLFLFFSFPLVASKFFILPRHPITRNDRDEDDLSHVHASRSTGNGTIRCIETFIIRHRVTHPSDSWSHQEAKDIIYKP